MLVCGRAVNLWSPIQLKRLVDALATIQQDDSSPGVNLSVSFPWTALLLYSLVKLLQGSSGLIATLQSTVWISIEQHTVRSVSMKMFEHLHRYIK